MTTWISETLHPHYQQRFQVSTCLFEQGSAHQHVAIYETNTWGRVLMLDGVVQTTEKDEFIYHEMFAHVPCMTHTNPNSVLILGGGDGGLLREVLKHQSVREVVVVEIDPTVIEVCSTYLPNHAQGAWQDPRVTVVINDGCQFLQQSQQQFDLILSDSTDPIGPGASLFSGQFYRQALARLRPEGLLVTQNGVSFLQLEESKVTFQRLRALTEFCGFYRADVPTYIGGNMQLAWASLRTNAASVKLEVLQARWASLNIQTRYYNPAVHHAAFALPEYVCQQCQVATNEEIA